VPLCQSVLVRLVDSEAEALEARPEKPTVTVVLSGSEEAHAIISEAGRPPKQDAETFAQILQQLQTVSEQHGYTFPGDGCNHDWIWSYGITKIPMAFREAAQAQWRGPKTGRSHSMVYGGVHVKSVLHRKVSWTQAGPVLTQHQDEYCREVPVRLVAVTFNCGGHMPSAESSYVGELFAGVDFGDASSSLMQADVVVVALQESCPLALAVDITDTMAQMHHAAWAAAISRALHATGREGKAENGNVAFRMVAEKRLVGLQLLAFVKEEVAESVTNLRSACVRCGALGAGNKGAVAVSFTLFSTSFCFVDCHLAAGETDGSAHERAHNFRQVLQSMRLESDSARSAHVHDPQNVFEHDVVLFAGDFNMRLWSDASMQSVLGRERTMAALDDDELHRGLMAKHDELCLQREKGGAFAAFEEAPLLFAPTYKLKPVKPSNNKEKTDIYDSKRAPAFCDRVFWRARLGVKAEAVAYERVSAVDFSDHRPVRLSLRVLASEVNWHRLQRLISSELPVSAEQEGQLEALPRLLVETENETAGVGGNNHCFDCRFGDRFADQPTSDSNHCVVA